MKSKETVCFNIKYTWHAISRMYNENAFKHGTTAAVGFVLLNIDFIKGTPATQIGPALGMEPTSLSRILKHMEKDGYIERRQDSLDKRMVRIYLTEKGKEKRELAKKLVLSFNESVRDKISDKKLETFFEVLNEIRTIIHNKNTSVS
jgi:DNA-binding MarR family transcriptional regulator